MHNFLWSGSIDDRKLVMVPWKCYCQPISEGGLGIKRLRLLNAAMLSKITWKLIVSLDFSSIVLRAHFLTL